MCYLAPKCTKIKRDQTFPWAIICTAIVLTVLIILLVRWCTKDRGEIMVQGIVAESVLVPHLDNLPEPRCYTPDDPTTAREPETKQPEEGFVMSTKKHRRRKSQQKKVKIDDLYVHESFRKMTMNDSKRWKV